MLTSNAFYTLFSFDARIKSSIVNSLSVTLNSPCDKNIYKKKITKRTFKKIIVICKLSTGKSDWS